MNLELKRPIVFFDLETTGTQVAKDRIVEISILKVFPNSNKESKTWLVNPTIPIPKEAAEIHGITDEKVINEPTFKQLSAEIISLLHNCDLAGYNSNKFDIPLLAVKVTSALIALGSSSYLIHHIRNGVKGSRQNITDLWNRENWN